VNVRIRAAACVVLAALAVPATADAHVTINPGEWEAGGFARFAVRVPNERDNADTTRVTMRLPENVVSASFQPVEGWKRTVQMERLDEPIEEEGEEPITERLATVTWSGGRIRPGEFQEFGISFQVPEDAVGEALEFPAIQRYSDGEVVRWIGPEDADAPAPVVEVLPVAEEEGETAATPAAEATPASAEASSDDDATGRANLALGVGIVGLLAGLGALGLTLFRRTG
jgi:periplasmic copper chaperone A